MFRQSVGMDGSIRPIVMRGVILGSALALVTIGQLGLLSHIVARVFLDKASLTQVAVPAVQFVAVTGLRALLAAGNEALAQGGTSHALRTLRTRLFAHLAALGPVWLSSEQRGELAATTIEGVDRLDPYIHRYLPQRYLSILIPLLIGAAVLSRDVLSGILLLATAPLIPVLMIFVGSYAGEHMRAQWESLGRLSAFLLDTIQGLPTLVLAGRGTHVASKLGRLSQEYRTHTMRVLRFAFLNSLVLEFMTTACIALVAVELGVRLVSGSIAFEPAFFILLLTPEFYRPLRDLGTHRHAAMEGQAANDRISQILAATPLTPISSAVPITTSSTLESAAVSYVPTATTHSNPSVAFTNKPPTGLLTVCFEHVDYTYPGNAIPALRDISLILAAGTQTALVGPSGGGKSTLVHMLMGYLYPTSGRVSVNGIALSELDPQAWRSCVALVPQRPYLFDGTVNENIKLGKPTATDAEVAWAAEQAGATPFIQELEHGYHTQIGERGARLSGGQAQRLALARAFLKDAPLVILDEPTSNLDPESERQIRLALGRLARRRTMLIVAHRLNSIYTADAIAVLDAGFLVEYGTHSNLVTQGKLYRRLVLRGEAGP